MIPTDIKSVDIDSQRYFTYGDYFIKDGIRYFKITNTGIDVLDDLILIHELVEEVLTRNKGIKEEDILKHDLWVEEQVAEGKYPDDAEPGEHEKSPYKKEHLLAEKIEKMIAKDLNIDWGEYTNHLNNAVK